MSVKKVEDEDRPYPLARLSQVIAKALEPLTQAVAALRLELTVFTGLLNEKSKATLDPLKVVDLETAIRAKGKWECGEQHCRQCSVDQNLHCLQEQGVGPKKGGD